nr:helix-turn-helix transcriptional regulator [uncultured Sphingobacterium sp.]
MASNEFRDALKALRIKFNLSQSSVAKLAEIEQTEYSALETGKQKLDIDSANNLSTKIWGVKYSDFVAFSNQKIIINKLPASTRLLIKDSENSKLNDSSNLLAKELDKLILESALNTPTTSKIIHHKMGEKLKNKKTSEITSLLGRSPRNKYIKSIGEFDKQKIYIHIDYEAEYIKIPKDQLITIIKEESDKILSEQKRTEEEG